MHPYSGGCSTNRSIRALKQVVRLLSVDAVHTHTSDKLADPDLFVQGDVRTFAEIC